MKNLFITLCLFIVVATTTNAQQIYQTFTADTTNGAETVYFTSAANVRYNGVIVFELKADGFAAGDTVTLTLQGTNDDWTKVQDVSSVVYGADAADDKVFVDNPSKYLNYRIKATGNAGDTVAISDVILIYKR